MGNMDVGLWLQIGDLDVQNHLNNVTNIWDIGFAGQWKIPDVPLYWLYHPLSFAELPKQVKIDQSACNYLKLMVFGLLPQSSLCCSCQYISHKKHIVLHVDLLSNNK